MDTRKLLVADASAEFCTALADALGGAYELRICHTGFEAKALLETFRPDVLTVDLALPGLDGLGVLKAAVASPHRPATLVVTGFMSPYIEGAVGQLGADYLMVKPCDLYSLTERIGDLADHSDEHVPVVPDPETTLTTMLRNLGISIGSRGFACLEEAVTLYERDPGQSVTKILYPAVAKHCGGRKEAVERVIRAAIQRAWEQRDEKLWRLYFPPCRDGSVPRPTNTVFIATLAKRLHHQGYAEAQ